MLQHAVFSPVCAWLIFKMHCWKDNDYRKYWGQHEIELGESRRLSSVKATFFTFWIISTRNYTDSSRREEELGLKRIFCCTLTWHPPNYLQHRKLQQDETWQFFPSLNNLIKSTNIFQDAQSTVNQGSVSQSQVTFCLPSFTNTSSWK